MKKRIEKVVECIEYTDALTIGKRYTTYSESGRFYSVMDDEGDAELFYKENFKVVSEKEILEFEGSQVYSLEDYYDIRICSKIDLTNYDLKVIATPKGKTYEEMSKEELIELLKAKE